MLGDVNVYWKTLQNVCMNQHEYVASNERESESYKCYQLLLLRKEIVNMLKQGAATRLLRAVISKPAFVELLFEMNKANRWGLEKQFGRQFR